MPNGIRGKIVSTTRRKLLKFVRSDVYLIVSYLVGDLFFCLTHSFVGLKGTTTVWQVVTHPLYTAIP